MSFKVNSLYYTDGYKVGHKAMLAPGTTRLYGTWIPRSLKYAPKGIEKIVSFGQQLVVRWLHDEFEENFFNTKQRSQMPESTLYFKEKALSFVKDMSLYLAMEYDGKHFEDLWDLGYLPIKIKSLPEGIETLPNIPHMTFINTVDGFAWLTLYLETIVSSLAWKPSTSATIALQYKRNLTKWIMKTDPSSIGLIPFLCHDFSARGLSPWDMITSGLGHATSFRGSDTLAVIPASRYFYGEDENSMPINSVNANKHSVTCTQLFYYEDRLKRGLENETIKHYYSFNLPCEGSIQNPDYLAIAEYMNLADWLKRFPKAILSYVGDTMNLWKVITHVVSRLKKEIIARDGKIVIRPDSGDPVDIICGTSFTEMGEYVGKGTKYFISDEVDSTPQAKGVIELLWDIFGGTINEKGYKVLDPHIDVIYGDSITLERQIQIYKRLEAKGFAVSNIVLGIGSYTYQMNTRDTLGWAAKGAWFEVENAPNKKKINNYRQKVGYNIYKDPVTDDGTKKSLKGLCSVRQLVGAHGKSEIFVKTECTPEEENEGLLQVIYEDGKFYNTTTLTEIREKINANIRP